MRNPLTREEVLFRIRAKQRYISTLEDLSEFGYIKDGKHRIGVQQWVLKKVRRTGDAKYRNLNRKKLRAISRKYYCSHKKEEKARKVKYKKDNPERVKAIGAKYRRIHLLKVRAACRKCYTKYPEKTKARVKKYQKEHPEGQRAAIAKRKRQLGYTLLMPLTESEVGHHVTNEHVMGIPERVHQRFCGHKRRKHRALILQWLKENDIEKYKMVLCISNK